MKNLVNRMQEIQTGLFKKTKDSGVVVITKAAGSILANIGNFTYEEHQKILENIEGWAKDFKRFCKGENSENIAIEKNFFYNTLGSFAKGKIFVFRGDPNGKTEIVAPDNFGDSIPQRDGCAGSLYYLLGCFAIFFIFLLTFRAYETMGWAYVLLIIGSMVVLFFPARFYARRSSRKFENKIQDWKNAFSRDPYKILKDRVYSSSGFRSYTSVDTVYEIDFVDAHEKNIYTESIVKLGNIAKETGGRIIFLWAYRKVAVEERESAFGVHNFESPHHEPTLTLSFKDEGFNKNLFTYSHEGKYANLKLSFKIKVGSSRIIPALETEHSVIFLTQLITPEMEEAFSVRFRTVDRLESDNVDLLKDFKK